MREISIERPWCRRLGRRRAAGACLPSLALCTATLLAAARSEGATAKTREEAPATVAVSQSGATGAATEGAAAVMAAQAPLLAVAERIKALDPAGAQVGGIQISVETGTLNLW